MTSSSPPPKRGRTNPLWTPLGDAATPSGVESGPIRSGSPRGSRIAAARARAARAKLLLAVAAVLAFFASVMLERGAATSPSSQSSGSVASSQTDSGTFFGSGSIAPAQEAPSTQTSVS
jgi:hypothetical protein